MTPANGVALSNAQSGADLDLYTGTNPAAVAKAFKASGLFPDLQSEAQAFVKVMAGRELGIGPMASMMGINVIQGKVTLSANLMAAQVKASSTYNYLPREMSAEVVRLEFFQNDDSIGVSEFSMEDAQRAGLLRGSNWQKYPKAMLFARALSQGVRWFCPDVLSGSPAYVPEEMGAQVNEEGDLDRGSFEAKTEIVNAQNAEQVDEVEEVTGHEVIDAERVEHFTEGFRAVGLNVGQIANLFGAAGLDGLRARSKKAIEERLGELSPAEADLLDVELERVANNG